MKQTVNSYDFVEAFTRCNRQEQFSRAGLFALFDYLEEYEDSTGEEIELDVIALCCDFAEYSTALEAAKEYGFEPDEDEDEEEQEAAALELLQDRTQVIEHDSGIIIQSF